MALTEEQKERIRKNRERALEIQKRRIEAAEAEAAGNGTTSEAGPPQKKHVVDQMRSRDGNEKVKDTKGEETEDVELEDFEVGASQYVTKKEAMKVYLLPEGTLAICKYEEKPNPHNTRFQPMKLYDRAEIRRLSRKRFGGLQGLVEERRRREEKRFQKDLEETKNLFKK